MFFKFLKGRLSSKTNDKNTMDTTQMPDTPVTPTPGEGDVSPAVPAATPSPDGQPAEPQTEPSTPQPEAAPESQPEQPAAPMGTEPQTPGQAG
ncbi:hypothetical protein LCGC14_2588750 [marine sediment metagenome]|uniref:Uncharacterized protein n=1 Tax=marine sediment metagenome TaxID=412755 RepID=A0A0F9CNC7_9ZZZZ